MMLGERRQMRPGSINGCMGATLRTDGFPEKTAAQPWRRSHPRSRPAWVWTCGRSAGDHFLVRHLISALGIRSAFSGPGSQHETLRRRPPLRSSNRGASSINGAGSRLRS